MQFGDVELIKKKKNYIWLCSICESQRRKNRNSSDSAICDMLSANNNRKVDDLFVFVPNNIDLNLQNIINQLKNNDTKMSDRFDSIDESIALVHKLAQENEMLKAKVADLELRLNIFEQKNLINSIEVSGVPKQVNENVENIVSTVITEGLKMTFVPGDIQNCFRVNNKSSDKPGKIIVVLKSSTTKANILNASRKLKSLSSKVIQSTTDSRIFINECLTGYNRSLLKIAKDVKREKNFKYLWIRNANIMMRKKDGDAIKYIRTFNDLDNL